MRILFCAKDSPWVHSGYGNLAANIPRRLQGHHEITIHAPVWQRGRVEHFEGIPVLPGLTEEPYDEDGAIYYSEEGGFDLVLTVGDVWPLHQIPRELGNSPWRAKWVQYLAMDWTDPTPPAAAFNLGRAAYVIPYTSDGQRRLQEQGLTNVLPYIWHGLDTKVWRPYRQDETDAAARSAGFQPDAFNVLIAQANQERKHWPEMLIALALFRERNPHLALRIFCHTFAHGDYDLKSMVEAHGLGSIVKWASQEYLSTGYFDDTSMAKLFAAADCVLDVAAEGFGFSIIQSQSVGTPVIALNACAAPELVRTGVLIEPRSYVIRSDLMRVPLPDSGLLADALDEVLIRQGSGWEQEGVEFIRENFDWDRHIVPQWLERLDVIERGIEARCAWGPLTPSEQLLQRAKQVRYLP